ncbi:hypothetical protein PDIG_88800 [Penicillium digitatum PHI26]|uniref:Myb-like domain-containing protein n=2 Tax=Penicillium digitatum TaxID=36651 RepID=K9F8Y4_PEND2|nr:hypothetical protein PDIP_32100 [Penicillium digitatum Pd1]EKV04532.1 hypothetical protein PDIG_88800 [Penicillium digitatum PHI26]EKV17280.1 hypothetical protein PDIP_32100 [Penicillium digitatum Pd1]
MEPSDISDSGDYENDSEPSQTSNLGENPCSRANKASERAEDPSTIEDTPATSRPSSPPTARSTLKCSRARTTLSSKPPVRYPSIAVVIPSTSGKQGAARTSTRAAAAVCKKRLRLGRGTGDHQDENTPYDTAQPCQKRKKRRPSIRPLSDPSKSSTYTSDENALLVRLKEKEAMSWSEITTHFPGRNMSSLQVHYSTKLRHKASSRSGRPKKRQ